MALTIRSLELDQDQDLDRFLLVRNEGKAAPTSPEQLRRWIDSLLSATAGKLDGGDAEATEEVDPELERARSLWDEAEFDEALAAYQAILDAEPNHAEAKDALRRRRGCLDIQELHRLRRALMIALSLDSPL